jgi:hypothetical protein
MRRTEASMWDRRSASVEQEDRMADHNAPIIEEFRAHGGKVGGFFEGASLLILHTKGAKSAGRRRSS